MENQSLESEARGKTVTDAIGRARGYARRAGAELGKVFQMREVGSTGLPPQGLFLVRGCRHRLQGLTQGPTAPIQGGTSGDKRTGEVIQELVDA
jgi:uncharacterized protein YggE